ncbi:MAG: ABC transporter ATP-binding protein [Thermoplasmata archaeon]|nr:ABC transporter ATP-binding protein [Thermoplasmata archaeon]MCI4353834.1 ABC transporter ATP-binding protein [Thermoplasmata archaeon]
MNGPAPPPAQVTQLSVRFGARIALHRVELTTRAGELVALTGPNGSGKTTLLRAILGLTPSFEGDVRLFGAPTAELTIRERARRVAWVPQEELPRDDVPILTYVLYGRYAHQAPFGTESDADRATARRALADAGLADRESDGIFQLSGGERQRLLLARALAQEAPLLLLDEPTAHLDIGHQLDLLERVRGLVRGRGVCAIAALHDLNLAARFADRVVVLSHGRRVADGAPSEVLTPPLLREVWGVDADLKRDPRTGQPYLLPRRLSEAVRDGVARGVRRGPVHVVGGGGSAEPLLRVLADEQYALTAGALPLLDSDGEACEELGVPYVAEIPFAPLSAEVRLRHRAMLDAARAIVVAPFPVGPTNLANLEDLVGRARSVPVLLVAARPGFDRDFTGGAATRLLRQLGDEGAVVVADASEMRRVLAERLSGSA